MKEHDAQAVALVRAVEETDRAGTLLPLQARRRATESARAARAGDGDAWLAARAGVLSHALQGELPFLPRLLRFTSPARGLLPPALALAFVLGLAANALGPEKRINVLAVPLLGLIAWNLAVLALLAIRTWLPVGPGSLSGAPRFLRWLEALARRLVERLPRRSTGEEQHERLKRALERYLAIWLPAVAPLAAARGRRLLHASSVALILGVVAGMYLRGVAFQYQATWESTFLTGPTVDDLLGALLAPASALLGVAVPEASAIESPVAGNAAIWIHLWAVTAALFVGLPRLALTMFEGVRVARRRGRVEVELPDGYVRRLLAAADTSQRRLEVVPYSYRPQARAVETLKQLLYDLFGPRSEIRLRAPLEYGFEPDELDPGTGRLRLVLFGLAQTPEVEVHGELLARVKDDLPDGQALLVVVDGSSYRQRLEGGEGAATRLAERRRAWDRVVRDAGLEALHVDLLQAFDDDLLTRATETAWPAGALENPA
ncbi:MAG: DUF2868 domain-containing protein [bacterium]|nr:DUF2868 domain-containing protein [bacterium]